MRCLFFSVSFISAFIFFGKIAMGQTNASPTPPAYQAVETYFQNEIGANSHLYTGEAYPAYAPGIKGDPFFMITQMKAGDIFYDGVLYKNIPMLYDITADKVIINRYNGNETMQLLNEKIKYFTFEGHRFENLATVEEKQDVSKKLFNVLTNGKATLLAQRIKHIKHGLKAEDPYSFVEEDAFWIRNGNNLFVVTNRNDALQALADKKTQVKIFIRKNRLKFKKKIEKDLIELVNYYESLTK